MDNPATVHQVNILTVVASESYKDFVTALQRDIGDSLSARPRLADEAYFSGKILKTALGDIPVTPQLAAKIYRYLVKNDYADDDKHITQAYHDARKTGRMEPLPSELAKYGEQIYQLVDSVFSDAQLPIIEDERKSQTNRVNANFSKRNSRSYGGVSIIRLFIR